MKNINKIIIFIILIVILTGCNSYAAINYKGKIVDGNLQHRLYTFSSINGTYEESMKIAEYSNIIDISVQIEAGTVDLELKDNDNNTIFQIELEGKENINKSIEGSFNVGTYRLIYKAQKAKNGQVELIYRDEN